MKTKFIFCYLLLLFLPACLGSMNSGPGLADVGEGFSEAMRWRDYVGAANHLHKDVRAEFLELFQADDDLKIVESRIVSVELGADGMTAEANYLFEYYRLPSMRIKKWQWVQQWQLEKKNSIKSGVWMIVNSPPLVP